MFDIEIQYKSDYYILPKGKITKFYLPVKLNRSTKAWLKKLKIPHPPSCTLDAVVNCVTVNYNTIARKPIMIANSAAPSTKAAARIMFARISLEASG